MKHPTPSDFTVEAKEAYVSVIFKPTDTHYGFGRLAGSRVRWNSRRAMATSADLPQAVSCLRRIRRAKVTFSAIPPKGIWSFTSTLLNQHGLAIELLLLAQSCRRNRKQLKVACGAKA
jgi:hypothetical protein